MATLRDIAERAGVAVSTVSRVLNARPGVSITEPVRKRIFRAARDLGYRPNNYARGLVRGRGTQIVLVFWSAPFQSASRRLRAMERSLADLGHPVVSTDAACLAPGPDALLELLFSELPEAVVLVGANMPLPQIAEVVEALHERQVHCIVADIQRYEGGAPPCDMVHADRQQGVSLAMSHLLDLGHRDIGLVHWSNALPPYERSLEEAGICARHIAQIEAAPTDEEYYALGDVADERVSQLLERSPEITALFCRNDLLALGAMRGAASLGLRVPEDLSIVGFDNDPWTALLPVPLTSMSSPLRELAERVTSILGARMDGDQSEWQRVLLPFELIARQSTAPAPDAVSARSRP